MVAKQVTVSGEDRAVLRRMARARSAERRMVERAQIVLLAAEGLSASRIAERVGCSEKLVKRWRARYERDGLEGLRDRPRSGRPLTHGPEVRARLIAKACTRPQPTSEGARRERLTYRELGESVGMSESQAHVILERADIKPHRTDYWIMSDFSDPEFEERLQEVCGLYVDPPESVLVVSIEEKTGIQAKSPTKPDSTPAPGKPARREHEYTRNGTQCLFACLNVKEGDVLAMPSKTRNRFDLIRFLDHLDSEIPAREGQEIVAVTDNLSTRRTEEVSEWLAAHPRWRFQFTPTHASWLNQVEIFFSILHRRLLKHGAFTSEQDLAEQMLAFIETYNQSAKPFKWTYTGKVLEA
jgi:transposase